MKAALTIWEDRVSPVFDSAHMLLVAEIKNAKIVSTQHERFNPEMPTRLAEMLNGLDVPVLICGAISEIPANVIEAYGIKLIPFIAGNVDEVLDSYAKGIKLAPDFLMPGCGRNCRRQRRKHPAGYVPQKEDMMPKENGTGPKGQGPGTGKGRGKCNPGKRGKGSGQGKAGNRGTGSGKGVGQGRGGGQGRGTGKSL